MTVHTQQSEQDIKNWVGDIHQGEASALLQKLPKDSIDCVITSPPYWGQRDYQLEGQLGAENNAEEYVTSISELFNELQRPVDGSFWLNLADTYNGNSIVRPDSMNSHVEKGEKGYADQLAENRDESGVWRRSTDQFGVKRRSRLFIPSRIATSLIESGWICRDEIIWAKNDPKPEGRVSTRLTRAHEKLYRFTTSEDVFFNQDAIDSQTNIWEISTAANDHPAPFPEDLVRRAIKLTTEEGDIVLDPFVGSGTTCRVAKNLRRRFVGFDLKPEFVSMAQKRLGLTVDQPELLTEEQTQTTLPK